MKGQGEIKGWITRHGVHIPIYDKYTVREGHEPGETGMKARWKTKKSKNAQMRDDIEKDVASKWKTYWKDSENMAEYDIKTTMEKVDDMLEYFKDKEIIEQADDYEKDIVWKFSGKDKSTGKFVQFDFNAYPRESDVRAQLKGNGYTVSKELVLPKALFNYVVDKTSITDQDMIAAKAVMKQALKEYKRKKGIKRHG